MSPENFEDELLEDEEEKEAALTAAMAAAPVPFVESGENGGVPDFPMAAPVSIKIVNLKIISV